MVAVCTARRIARSIASSVCKKPMASSIASSAPTDIDQLLLDGTNAAHYTTAEWPGYEHLLKDQKTDVGTLRVPRGQRCYDPDGVDDYIAVASLTGSETVVSSSGTSTPSIAAGRINFTAGTVWDITLSNGSRYLCNEESGSTAYDISDNAAHGTITNATLASFHSTSASVLTNRNNDVGYRLSGSVYIPKRLNSSLAADGNALTVTGKCPQPGYAPQKVATFDGVNDYATLGARLTTGTVSTLTVSAWIYPTIGDFQVIAGEYNNTGNQRSWMLILYASSNILTFYRSDSGGAPEFPSASSISTNAWTHVAVVVNGTSVKFYINGSLSLSTTTTQSTLYNSTSAFKLGAFNVADYPFNGRMADARVYSSAKSDAEVLAIKRGTQDTTNLLGQWPMCEGPGSGNTNTTIYDVSGNGKHLTITNATISSFWAAASTYDSCIPNHPLKYGYTIDGSGVVVPAKLDGLLDAAGNAIGTAAGKWKSGLQNINCLPYTNPLGVNIGLETALDPTADRKTASSSKRRRRNTSGLYDRMGARATAMSDSNASSYFGD